MVGVHPSCALLGGFAVGARVALLWQHSINAKCQRVLVLALCLVEFAENSNNSAAERQYGVSEVLGLLPVVTVGVAGI